MLLKNENEIAILYSGRSISPRIGDMLMIVVDVATHISKLHHRVRGRNDVKSKVNKVRIKQVYRGYNVYDSSRLFIPWGLWFL